MPRLQLSDTQKKWSIVGLVVVVLAVVVAQLLYPRDHLVPFASIDGIGMGGWKQKDATWELDHQLNRQEIPLVITQTNQTYKTIYPKDIGLSIHNTKRVESASYPLWARLIPTSLLWYQATYNSPQPEYTRDNTALEAFMKHTLGDCQLEPKNAGISYDDDKLLIVPSSAGGTCNKNDVLHSLQTVEPTVKQPASVRIDGEVMQPEIDDDKARQTINDVTRETEGGITIDVAGDSEQLAQKDVLSWLVFTPKKTEYDITIDTKKSDAAFGTSIAKKVTKPAGITTIKTQDYTVVAKKEGSSGRTLDGAKTRASILSVVTGKASKAQALTTAVKPKVTYSRSYTKTSTGIAAMLTHYAHDNPGVYGVSFVELGGQGRAAAHDQNRVFTTASTYKLFVAFSTLKRVDSGSMKWSNKIVDSRDLEQCFDDMIVKSDNACAEALIKKIGRDKLDQDLRSIGLTKSTFRAASNQTTAAELAIFLTKLENKSLPLKSASRDRLLGAMKRQVYRQGIPAGTNGTVADKVGFLNGLLHDASIVYSPKGKYVLVILTDNSTWANIADITRKIEALR